jgi:sulfide:quinone oxidoreductase
VDAKSNKIRSWDEKEVEYDLLVTIPTNMGDPVIERSGMGDELNFVPTHPKTLQSKKWENIFIIGDATNLPSSKAGSVAHFQAEILQENLLRAIDGLPLREDFDGHANCFIESGFGRGMLIDFNYDVEPLPGKYPLPGIGPFSLLEETKMNHWGKMMFRWVYWNILIKGGEMPIEAQMNMAGKIR